MIETNSSSKPVVNRNFEVKVEVGPDLKFIRLSVASRELAQNLHLQPVINRLCHRLV